VSGIEIVGRLTGSRQAKAAVWWLVAVGAGSVLAEWIVTGSTERLIYLGLGLAVLAISVRILNNWRDGFYMFIFWLLFEDLVRKYMGNNMAIYFGKDFLVGITYLSFFLAIRRHQVQVFRPPFLVSLLLLVWVGLAQVFNPNSPSVLYGVLGLKLYFYYAPLMLVGYAIIKTEEDLRHFLVFNMGLAGVIGLLGIIQSIVGFSFLNPQVLAPDIQELGSLTRKAPITGEIVMRPSSVFVSDGRFAAYMILMFIVGMGAAGYLLLRTHKGRRVVFPAIALSAVAAVMSGSRGAFIFVGASTALLSAGMLWGAPFGRRERGRLLNALRRSATIIALGLFLVFLIFPEDISARWFLYSETLSPDSPSYELGNRVWTYPVNELTKAFDNPNWFWGNGIGTASLGMQYVSRLMGVRRSEIGVESGYGDIVLELGIFGLVFWLIWTIALVTSAWKVVRKVKETCYFPVALAILWFAFILLFLETFGGIQAFQNYINNAYLWLLLGILFRLRTLAIQTTSALSSNTINHGA
jgi:hypothetical protein